MNFPSEFLIADVFRVFAIVLYGLTIGETASILKRYFRVIKETRRLLPWHVVGVSFVLLGFETEVVYENIMRLGSAATWYIPINLTLFLVAYVALVAVRMHMDRKVDLAREICPLVQDSKEFD